MSAMEPHYILLPPLWAEKHIAPLLAEARAGGGSLMANFARVEFDANAPADSPHGGTHAGALQVVVCVVPEKATERLRKVILAEREKLVAKGVRP